MSTWTSDRASTGSSGPFGGSTSRARSSASPSPSGSGLSESDIDALELLIDTGAATAGRISEAMGLTTGAVTRVIDRLEQAGYVRRTTDPADRRRVVIEVVPERVATVESLLDSLGTAAAADAERYSHEQLATINDFLSRMADLTQTEATRIRTDTTEHPSRPGRPVRAHGAAGRPRRRRGCSFRAGAQDLRLRTAKPGPDLYRARFDGATPQVRVRDGRVLVQYRGMPFDWRKRVGDDGAQPVDPVGDRGRRGRQPRRGRPDRARPRSVRAHRRLGADPARGRPAARRGPDPHDRRHQGHPPRAPERRAGPARDLGWCRLGRGRWPDDRPPGRRTRRSSRAAGRRPATATASRSPAARRPSRSSSARRRRAGGRRASRRR